MTTMARWCGSLRHPCSAPCCHRSMRHSRSRFRNPWRGRSRTFMSSSINTAWKGHNLRRVLEPGTLAFLVGVLCLAAAAPAQDSDLRAPSSAVAGNALSIATTGSGTGTFYLVGPSIAVKREVTVGQDVQLSAKELQSAGTYLAIVCSGNCRSVGFFVAPAKPVNLTFLVHPSRAPVGQPNIVSGVALPFDEFHN